MNIKKGTITGREIMILLGNYYQYLHEELKNKYDKEFDVRELLEPFFESKSQIYRGIKDGIKKMNAAKAMKQIQDQENGEEIEELNFRVIGFNLFVFLGFILGTFGFAIYGVVKFIQKIFL